jgi:hypothetical protein
LTGQCGWYADVELAYVFSDVLTRVRGDSAAFGSRTDFRLNDNVAPTFTVGYGLPNGNGAIFGSYRYLGTDGSISPDDFSNGQTRLDINDFSAMYRFGFALGSGRLQTAIDIGGRLTSIYYDISYNYNPPVDLLDIVSQLNLHGSSRFLGAGPSIGLSSDFAITPCISWYVHSDFAALFGEQTFRTSAQSIVNGVASSEGGTLRRSTTVKALRAETGLNWAPPSTPHMLFQLGYSFEYFWDVGRFDDACDDVMLNGIFARARFSY